MNLYELIASCLAGLLLLAYLRWQFKSWRIALFLTAVSGIALYLALLKVSQFLTVDETYIIFDPLDLALSSRPSPVAPQWARGPLRTSDALLAPVIRLLISQKLLGRFAVKSGLQALMILKILHWLTGFVAVLWLHYVLDKHFVPPLHRKPYFVVFIYTVLLLPTNLLAFKVFNYDLLSMLLGVIASVYVVLALKDGNSGFARVSIILAILATQEKLSAVPVVFLAIATYAWAKCNAASQCNYSRLLGNVSLGFVIALLVSTASLFIIVCVQLTKYPAHEVLADLVSVLSKIADPIMVWAGPIFLFLLGTLSESDLMTSLRIHMPILLAISVLITYLLSIVLQHATPYIRKHVDALSKVAGRASILLVIVAFLTGVLGIYFVDVYLAPLAPIEPGNYHPVGRFLGMTWHFGAASFLQHLARFVAFAYGGFVQGIPTVYWLSFMALLVLILRRQQKPPLGFEVVLMLALLVPLGFGILQIPVAAKYMNINLLLFALMLTLKLAEIVNRFSQTVQASYALVFVTLLLLELLPFGPLFFAFRPIWVNYEKVFNKTPAVGQINTAWLGWGEEIMLTGQWLEEQCALSGDEIVSGVPCSSIRLYSVYTGNWLDEDKEITIVPFWTISRKEQLSYTEADYYIINRASVVQMLASFPDNVQPVYVITMRGYEQAWVFRGDHLQQAGFEF